MADEPETEPQDGPLAVEQAGEVAAVRQRRAVKRPVFGESQETPARQAPKETPPGGNPFDQYDADPDAKDPDLRERARLNAVHSFYRGTLFGATRMTAMAHFVTTPDAPDTPAPMKAARDRQRDDYAKVVADLARYDLIRPWGTSSEGLVSLGAQLGAALLSPESLLGVAAKGATVAIRTGRAALQQAGIMGAVDPVIQALSINAGVQDTYSPVQTASSMAMGAIIGGGMHLGGELISNALLKRRMVELAQQDPQFKAPQSETLPQAERTPAEVVRPDGTTVVVPPRETPSADQVAQDIGRVAPAGSETRVDINGETAVSRPETTTVPSRRTDETITGEAAAYPAQPGTNADLLRRRAEVEPRQELAIQRASGGELPMERARPDAGLPTEAGLPVTVPETPSPAREVAIRSLQQQAFDLADAVGFPLRQGRITNKDALGTFNTGTGVVRVKEVPDFEVVSHEAGHAIEAKIGRDLTDLTNRFSAELTPLVTAPDKYDPAQWTKEGFAEFIRRMLGNPAWVAREAPGFNLAFRDFMQTNHPELLNALDRAGEAYRAYIEAPSADAIHSVVRSRDEEATGWRAVAEKIKEDGFPDVVQSFVQRSYDALLDRFSPVARAMRDVAKFIKEKEGGALIDLKAADNPEVHMRLIGRTQQAAVLDMMDGVRPYKSVTPRGPSLRDTLAHAFGDFSAWGKWDPDKKALFSDYLVSRRADVMWDKFTRGDIPNPPVPFSQGDARQAMAELVRANPTFHEASDMLHAYTRELLTKQYDGGLIGADLYNKLMQEPFYVPLMRDVSDKPVVGSGGLSSEGPGKTQTVNRFRGSQRDIKDPIESIMLQTFLVNRTLRHNDMIRTFVNYFGRAGIEGGRFVEPLPAYEAKKYTFDLRDAVGKVAKERGMDTTDIDVLLSALTDVHGEDPIMGSFFRMEAAGKRGEPIVFYKEGGELRAARFMSQEEGHNLYELVTALPTGLQDLSLQVLSTSSGILRSGIVTNPMFMLTNFIRDQVAAGILRPDYIPFYHGVKGIVSEVRQTEAAELYGYAGAVSAGAKIAPLEQVSELSVDALKHKGYAAYRLGNAAEFFKNPSGKNLANGLHGLLELSSVTEAGTRNSIFESVYNQKKSQGLSDYEAMFEAAFQAQDILDFSRWGSKTQAIRALTPFVNAHLQGLDKARRTLFDPIIRQAVNGATFVTDREAYRNALLTWGKLLGVGGALGAAWAALHASDNVYQDASPEIKGANFVTSIAGKMLIIPKPFELSVGFTAGEYAFQRMAKEDPRAGAQFLEAAWEVIKPPLPIFDNPLLKTTAELAAGVSFYPSLLNPRPLIPDALKRLEPSQQFTDRTSTLAKQIGALIGVSPIKVDYGIGNYFGLWGRDIMALSSGVDPDKPEASWEDAVFVRRFIKDPTRSSDVTQKFWQFMGQTTGQFNRAITTYDTMVKQFRDDDAKTFLSKLPGPERAFVTLKSAANEDGKPAFTANERRIHPLQRAYDAVTVLNGVRREMDNNNFVQFENGTRQVLSREERGRVRDAVRELAQLEMRNALVIMKEPGYANRPVFDVQATMDKIRNISPSVADEITTRYATARIATTTGVAKTYQQMQERLVRDGSTADLAPLSDEVFADGFEFGGERVKKPAKRRIQIPNVVH